MPRLFISHAGENTAEAVAIFQWLQQEGWEDVFFDRDRKQGLMPGEHWEQALVQAASNCEAVLFLISRNWLNSEWCREEFDLARHLNKSLFAVIISSEISIDDLPNRLKGTWQAVDLTVGRDHLSLTVALPGTHEKRQVSFSSEALARLRNGLAKAGLDPRFFAWPPEREPDRAPYRGLDPLEAEDAGIFFGRDAPIVEALGKLRQLQEAAAPRVLVILGASGAGKSSFLRAGLLPRIARDDRRFLPLPVIRPEHAAISGKMGFLSAIEMALAAHGLAQSRANLREVIASGTEAVRSLLSQLVASATVLPETGEAKPPALVLAIDQAEELFQGAGADEARALVELVCALVTEDQPLVIALFTIRSDGFNMLETAKQLEGVQLQTLPLLPMPRGAYQTVIEGPAGRLKETRRNLSIEPKLIQRLLEDIEKGGGSDALPLLAFTLEQLYRDYGGNGALRLADYDAFGGIRGAIEAAVERALAAADSDPRIPRDREAKLKLLRHGLIPWLAGIDPETSSPRRRVARLADIPDEAKPLIDLLVEQRLLTTDLTKVRDADKERTETTIEPAHEALLRQWGLLRGWLEEDFAALTTLEGVKRAARDWAGNAYREEWLNHSGTRLQDAEAIAARADLAGDLSADAGNYLRACRKREEALKREQRTRLYGRVAALVVLTVGVAVAGVVSLYQWNQLSQNLSDAKVMEYRQAVKDGEGKFFGRSIAPKSQENALAAVQKVFQLVAEVRTLREKKPDDVDVIAVKFYEYRAILKAELGDPDGSLHDMEARQVLLDGSDDLSKKAGSVRLPEISPYAMVVFDLQMELNIANTHLKLLLAQRNSEENAQKFSQAIAQKLGVTVSAEELKSVADKDPRTAAASALRNIKGIQRILNFVVERYPREQDFIWLMNYLELEAQVEPYLENWDAVERALAKRVEVARHRLDFMRKYNPYVFAGKIPEYLAPDKKHLQYNAAVDLVKAQQDLINFHIRRKNSEKALAAAREKMNTLEVEADLKSWDDARFSTRNTIANLIAMLGDKGRASQEVEAAGAARLEVARNELKSDWADLSQKYRQIAAARHEVDDRLGAVQAARQALSVLDLQAQSPAGPASTPSLTTAYLALSWHLLFAKQFADAAATVQKGLDLKPDEHLRASLYTNLAHALLFQGSIEQALAIYEAWKTKPVGNEKVFANSIVEDFDEFERFGLKRPEMSMIRISMEAAVRATPKSTSPAAPQ